MTRTHALLVLAALSVACGRESPATAPTAGSPIAAASPATKEPNPADGTLSCAGTQNAESLAKAKADGVKVIVCNLTDEEVLANPTFGEQVAAETAGMRWVHIAIDRDKIEVADVDAFAKVMAESDGKVLMHCASGNRSAGLYAAWLAREKSVPVDQAIEQAKALGLAKAPTIEAVRKVAAEP